MTDPVTQLKKKLIKAENELRAVNMMEDLHGKDPKWLGLRDDMKKRVEGIRAELNEQ